MTGAPCERLYKIDPAFGEAKRPYTDIRTPGKGKKIARAASHGLPVRKRRAAPTIQMAQIAPINPYADELHRNRRLFTSFHSRLSGPAPVAPAGETETRDS